MEVENAKCQLNSVMMEVTVSITQQIIGRPPGIDLEAQTQTEDQAQETGLESQAQETVSHTRTARLNGFSGRSHSPISLNAHGKSAREVVKQRLEMIGINR